MPKTKPLPLAEPEPDKTPPVTDGEFRAECRRLEERCSRSLSRFLDAKAHANQLKEQHDADVAELRQYVRTDGGRLPIFDGNGEKPEGGE